MDLINKNSSLTIVAFAGKANNSLRVITLVMKDRIYGNHDIELSCLRLKAITT
jgi:hypothetical protein